MLTYKEEKYILYWQEKRKQSKNNPLFFIKGFGGGLIIGLLIIISILIGWYPRADMDASTKLNPYVLLLCVIGISLFVAFFYTNFRYEQNEQFYQELLNKKNKKSISENKSQ